MQKPEVVVRKNIVFRETWQLKILVQVNMDLSGAVEERADECGERYGAERENNRQYHPPHQDHTFQMFSLNFTM